MKLKLMNKSLEFLRDTLAAPGWSKGDNQTKKIKHIYLAGKMIAEILPEQPAPPVMPQGNITLASEAGQAYKRAVEAYNKTSSTPEFELDAPQFETCQTALKSFLDEGKFPSGINTNELIEQFKLLD
jgi:hypothetical protein